MEWSSNADTSFSSLEPTSSKEEELFSTSLISSPTSDVYNITRHTWEVADVATHVYLSNPPCSSPKMYTPLPEKVQTCRRSKILPSSLLLSVTKKVRDGTVSKSEITPNDLKACPIPAPSFHKVNDDSSSNKLLSKISPPPVKCCVNENPSTHFLGSNIISNVDCNISPLAFFLKAEVTGDVEDDKLGTSVNSETSICTIYSDDETRNKLRAERPTKPVPNYFISIQFSDPDIYGSLKEVHKSIMKKNGNCSLAAVPLHSLHMTLAVMRLDSEEDMARARSALNRCGDELRPKYRHELLELPLQGLGNFRHSVVFAKVRPGEHVSRLEEIAAVVQRRFCEEGLVDNKHDFTPHVTVLKLSRVGKKLTKKTGLKKIYPDIYEEFVDGYFGTQKVHDLQLCSMLKAKDISGYYQVEHKIEFGVDYDDGTTMSAVNGGSKGDSLTLTPTSVDSAARQNNPEPTMSKNPEDVSLNSNIPTNKVSCEKKMEFDCVIPKEALNKDYIYSYTSEMFIHITGQKNNDALHPEKLSMFTEKTEANLIAEELINTSHKTDTNFSSVVINLPVNIPSAPIDKPLSDSKFTSVAMYFPGNLAPTNKSVSENIPLSDKPVSDTNFSSVSINVSENIPPSDKPVSDANFSSVSINVSENIPLSDKPVSDANFSSVSINVSENIPPSNKPVSDANFSSVSINVSENIPPSDKPVSDANFSSVSKNVSENIPPSDKPVSDVNFSSVSINVSENIPPSDKPVSDANFSSVSKNVSENIPASDKPVSDVNFSSVSKNVSENIPSSDKPVSDTNFSSVSKNVSENIPPSDKPMSDVNFSSISKNVSEKIPPSDKPMSDAKFSSVSINLPENIPHSDKPVSDANFSSVSKNVSDNIPPSEKPVSDANFFSDAVNLSENTPPSNKPVSDANFSSVSINFPENIPYSDKPVSDKVYMVVTNLSEKLHPSDKLVHDNVSSVICFPDSELTSDKTLSEVNISSIRINLPENIPQLDEVVSDANFSSRAGNLSDNMPVSDRLEMRPAGDIFGKKISENNEADLPDYSRNSSDDAPLPEVVCTRTDLCSDEVVPALMMVNQANGIVEESPTSEIINVNDSGVNSSLLQEISSSMSMIVPTTVAPQTPVAFQDIDFTGNASVTDISAMVEDAASAQVFPISSSLSLNDLEFAEEATEGLSSCWDNPEADDLIQNKTADVCSIASKTSDGNRLNTVPSMPKKRRKMEKCSVM